MRVEPFSTAEKEFILQSFRQNQRIDTRQCNTYRDVKLLLGRDRGSCIAILGNTKVLVTVSCEMVVPKPGRPQDGDIFVNVEMSPMADPHFEIGRLGEGGIQVCRLLERIIKDSRCIDTESLCVQSGEKVWHIRVDVHVLDNDGSIIDCASAAAITALIHFRRPDVSVVGQTVIVHSEDEREPVPLNLYHQPVAVTFGFIDEGTVSMVDPSEREEHVLEGTVVYVMNSRREICALHCSGGLTVNKSTILKCGAQALSRAIYVIEKIKTQIAHDAEARSQGKELNAFIDDLWIENVTSFQRDPTGTTHKLLDKDSIEYHFRLPKELNSLPCDVEPSTSEVTMETSETFETEAKVVKKKKRTARLGKAKAMMNEKDSENEDDIDDEILNDIRDSRCLIIVEKNHCNF